MRYINLLVQTGLIVIAAATGVMILIGYPLEAFFFMTQFALGLWQYVGCMLARKHSLTWHPLMKRYMSVASSYLFFLMISPWILAAAQWPDNAIIYLLFLLLPPWALAIFYYVITYKRAFFNRGNGGRFLPHLSF